MLIATVMLLPIYNSLRKEEERRIWKSDLIAKPTVELKKTLMKTSSNKKKNRNIVHIIVHMSHRKIKIMFPQFSYLL